ncbi:SusD-like starch-binding protein associating with outer membrane [Kordia periserrulae]|uniref:SusD-like starch-binding protein associating with outer membrane n=1 Tax=Kordia periserrulae TaxID=701523 RepID=A0A2T6BY27_9FLAO|nr:SusD/RagB family nutrient-binding outer membrane lipoprotein [Kordia periserrulae]PTX60965.1 SusD-like starch-binding protein associating with outer membrane [Kordia periserrulae]
MKIKNNKLYWLLGLILVFSCETTELDLLVDPNVPTPEALDPDTNLNFIQFQLAEFFEDATESGAEAVRLEYMFNTYEINFNNTNASNSGMWSTAYTNILNEVEALIPVATTSGRSRHLGVARIIRAYTMMTMVDYFGDVPYSEALQGNGGIIFPAVDNGADVYDAALAELDLALADFANIDGNTPTFNDLYYGEDSSNSMANWTKLANTLKFKYYLNRRLIDPTGSAAGINALLATGDIITTSSEDFKWASGTSINPQSRHPYFVEEYLAANTGEYIPNYLMWALAEEKGFEDPRLRYYVYRQVNSFPTDPATLDNEISCWNDPRPTTYDPIDAMQAVPLPFCSLFGRGDGYWGRDHANREGIPPDNNKRSTFGVYPVGGRFDDNDADTINDNDGLQGAGIWPIMMDSFVYFMRAEAALYLGTSDDAAAMLEQGVRSSLNTVTSFLPNPGDFTNTASATDIDDYVANVMTSYMAASTDAERMDIIGKEYWIAMYGNGVEGYNLYRRTGAPGNLQPTLLGTGTFPRSFLYPNITVDRNINISQKPGLAVQVFWDNNPAEFIQ